MTTHFRPATPNDTPRLFRVSDAAIADFARRQGYGWTLDADDPAYWDRRRPLYDYLAANADHAWVAEDGTGALIGYARSILNEGVRELTEFFVLPGQQSAGVGGELLARAFPAEGARRRFIVATSDARALARYLKAGVYPRFPIYEFRGAPEAAPLHSDLRFEPLAPAHRQHLAAIDQAVLGYRRDALHAWLAGQRDGFVAWRGPEAAGYGYVGDDMGPVAALAEADVPALLAHAEREARARSLAEIGFEVPLINKAAVQHLLGRGYQMQRFFAFFMSDEPFGAFEKYVVHSPPFFV